MSQVLRRATLVSLLALVMTIPVVGQDEASPGRSASPVPTAAASIAPATPTAGSWFEAIETRPDFAGRYRDRERGVMVYRFVGEAPGAEAQLLDHYADASRFAIDGATYTLSDLQGVQAAIADRDDELRASGLDIREVGVDVSENRVDVGAYHSLGPTREALSAYGDRVHVYWSEGAFTGPEPVRGKAVRTKDDVKVRLTLDDYPLVAGKPAWITTKVVNVGDTPITYVTDSCENAVGVRGVMVGESWRPGQPVDLAAIAAAGRSRYNDLRWRAQEWTTAGDPTIGLGFAAKGVTNAAEWTCADVAISHRVPPGGVVEQRRRWDGQALGRLGPPPDGLARISGSFDFRRPGTRGTQVVEVELDVPVTNGRDPTLLHPMEAVDAALADDTFRELIEPVEIGDGSEEVILYDARRDVWVVGACGDSRRHPGSWTAAVVDPSSGQVERILDRSTGRYCYEGPWKARS